MEDKQNNSMSGSTGMNPKEIRLYATVVRADTGAVEDYGLVSYYSRNPVKSFLVKAYYRFVKGRILGKAELDKSPKASS